jgi:mannose-6-phosphate isomerase-like protein (cupin superfamily)
MAPVDFRRRVDRDVQRILVGHDQPAPLENVLHTDYVDRVKHVLKGRGLVVSDEDTLYVTVNSSAEIDWSHPETRLQFEESAVMER